MLLGACENIQDSLSKEDLAPYKMPAHRLWMKSGASGRAVNLDHTAINDDKDTDIQRPHVNADKDGLEPQPEQLPQIHFHQPRFQICHN